MVRTGLQRHVKRRATRGRTRSRNGDSFSMGASAARRPAARNDHAIADDQRADGGETASAIQAGSAMPLASANTVSGVTAMASDQRGHHREGDDARDGGDRADGGGDPEQGGGCGAGGVHGDPRGGGVDDGCGRGGTRQCPVRFEGK